jgi:hypothetical protein
VSIGDLGCGLPGSSPSVIFEDRRGVILGPLLILAERFLHPGEVTAQRRSISDVTLSEALDLGLREDQLLRHPAKRGGWTNSIFLRLHFFDTGSSDLDVILPSQLPAWR